MSQELCSLCHTSFHPTDVICHSPIFGDHKGVLHTSCMKQVEDIMELEGTNDVSHIIYPDPIQDYGSH